MIEKRQYNIAFAILTSLFLIFSVYWAVLNVTGNTGDKVFGSTYGLVALVGGICGLIAARSWGFFKSYFGKAIIFLSFGLLLAEFGQLAFTYLSIVDEAIPYPSIADIGFFGAIPMYIAGAYYLMRGLGAGAIVAKRPLKLAIGIIVPLCILALSYAVFLDGYDPTGLSALTVFLDFGYPLGQAIYVSIALVLLLSLGRMLGGVMRGPVLLLLIAFIVQYAADFNFLYQTHNGTWQNGKYGDYLYLVAYFVMGLSLIFLNRALAKAFAKREPTEGS